MRRLKLSLAAAFGCALVIAGGASALGAFLVDKPNQFLLAWTRRGATSGSF